MIQRKAPISGNPIIVQVDPAMEPIVPEFLSNARADAGVLREAIGRSDYDTIARLGHSMKGACGFGFNYLGDLGASMEGAAKAGELAKISELADELESFLDRVQPVYKAD